MQSNVLPPYFQRRQDVGGSDSASPWMWLIPQLETVCGAFIMSPIVEQNNFVRLTMW